MANTACASSPLSVISGVCTWCAVLAVRIEAWTWAMAASRPLITGGPPPSLADGAWRGDTARQDEVDGDAVLDQVERAGVGQADQRRLGGGVGRVPLDQRPDQGRRGDVDDPSALAPGDHRPGEFAAEQVGAAAV